MTWTQYRDGQYARLEGDVWVPITKDEADAIVAENVRALGVHRDLENVDREIERYGGNYGPIARMAVADEADVRHWL